MDALEPLRALYEYNAWADGHVLDAASALTEAELARDLGASFGSVRGTLRHLAEAQALWLSRWTGARPAGAPLLHDTVDLATLRRAFDAAHAAQAAFLRSLEPEAFAQPCSYTDSRGAQQERPLWQSLLHVVNHGTHHRAEIAQVLTSLGNPPRQLDYIFFEIERAGGPPRLV
jgi:uncharacterized damage-inducible protein DinB